MMSKNILLIVVAVLFAVSGELLLKIGMNKFGVVSLDMKNIHQTVFRLLKEPLVLGALATYFVSAFFWIAALSRLNLSYAYPMMASMGYVSITLASRYVLGEDISVARYLGVGVICLGLAIIARS
jgi:multidrug transporter EmrE-like cation transporter